MMRTKNILLIWSLLYMHATSLIISIISNIHIIFCSPTTRTLTHRHKRCLLSEIFILASILSFIFSSILNFFYIYVSTWIYINFLHVWFTLLCCYYYCCCFVVVVFVVIVVIVHAQGCVWMGFFFYYKWSWIWQLCVRIRLACSFSIFIL